MNPSETPYKTLVMGASTKPERYAYLAIQRLRQHGHPVEAIGLKPGRVGDVEITTEHPPYPDVDTITLYLRPERQVPLYDYLLSLKPRRIIFNPGTENPEFEARAKAEGVEPVEACTLVLLGTGQF